MGCTISLILCFIIICVKTDYSITKFLILMINTSVCQYIVFSIKFKKSFSLQTIWNRREVAGTQFIRYRYTQFLQYRCSSPVTLTRIYIPFDFLNSLNTNKSSLLFLPCYYQYCILLYCCQTFTLLSVLLII
jgi:hypothetical protein